MIFSEFYAFYSEKFCKFSRTLFRKYLNPQLSNSSINFIKLFFSRTVKKTFTISIKVKKNFESICEIAKTMKFILCTSGAETRFSVTAESNGMLCIPLQRNIM